MLFRRDATSRATVTTLTEPVSTELVEADIPGATLDEPLDIHNITALHWWLQCHDIKLASSCKKQQLITRLDLLKTSFENAAACTNVA